MYSWILPSGVENANTKDVATAASIPLWTRNTANRRIIGQGCCQAKGVKCLEGCKVYSSEVVREDFLPKVALELGIEEWWKSWGMALQSQRQWERLGLLLHTYMKCWSVMFFSPRAYSILYFYNMLYLLASSRTRVLCNAHGLGECSQLCHTHMGRHHGWNLSKPGRARVFCSENGLLITNSVVPQERVSHDSWYVI